MSRALATGPASGFRLPAASDFRLLSSGLLLLSGQLYFLSCFLHLVGPVNMRVFSVALAVLLSSQPVLGQRGFPTVTTLSAIATYPIFFHAKSVVVAGEFRQAGGQTRLVVPGGNGPGVDVLWNGPAVEPGGAVEARGIFLDVGRLAPNDPQTSMNGLEDLVRARARIPGRWPAEGEVLALVVSTVVPLLPPADVPSLRALALDPGRYAGRRVTVAGQFGGRNLFGDAPRSPGTSRNEFVVRSAGAAVWVTGMPPGGKKWILNPDSKLDTNAWLEVTGTVREGSGLVWIEAANLLPVAARAEPADPFPAPATVAGPPPKVVFSLPAADDTDVAPTAAVKFQLSRDLDPATLTGQVLVGYAGAPADAPPIGFRANWDRTNRVLELSFEQPLERFRTVRIELRSGIKGTDGQALIPCSLTFSTGG